MTSVSDDNSTTRVQAAPMLPCLKCDEPIRYAINRGISLDQSWNNYRSAVGDLCERCAIHDAGDDVRPGMVRDLQVLQGVRRRFNFPPSCTFQNFLYLPRQDRKELRGFSMESVGVWVTPSEGTRYFQALADVVRHENIPAEILWIQDTYEHIEIVDNDKRASIAQLRQLMDGMAFLREQQNARSGRKPIELSYEDAVQAYWTLVDSYEESAFRTGAKDKPPTHNDVADYLDISPSKLYDLARQWRAKGLKWKPNRTEE